MDVDEDDDFYSPEEAIPVTSETQEPQPSAQPEAKAEQHDDGLEEGEEEDEEDEGSDSDIDIITERKDGSKAAPASTARYNEIRNIGQRTASGEGVVKSAPVKKETPTKGSVTASGADLPAVATSKIDIDAKPIYEPVGKPITEVDIDEDLPDHDKPWRRPGTDISDYFNYGFDEFTWALYASKQENLRSDYDQKKVAENNKKMFEDMNMMMAMGGMPGMPGIPGATGGNALPSMPGMEGIPPEMQAMMQQMMASGIDPSQMDPATMFAGMAAAQGSTGASGTGQIGNQSQGFGGQQSYGQGGQNQGYGYEQNVAGQGNRGNFRGRGRGHRNW